MNDETIHDAARSGNLVRLRELISLDPYEVNARDTDGRTPIFIAAVARRRAAVEHLLETGADLAANDGAIIDHAARVADNKEIVRLLILHGALEPHIRPANDELRQFFAAILLANERRTESMLRLHSELATVRDGRGRTALHHAARNGDVGIMRILIERGSDVDATTAEGESVLYGAVVGGHFPAVELLLERRVDTSTPLADGRSILEWGRERAAANPAVRSIVWAIEDYEEESR